MGENSGLALNCRIWVEPTFTVTLAWIWPDALLAVKVYVVEVCGLTVWQPVAGRPVPTPLLMLTLVVPSTCQQSVEVCPALMVVGLALKTTTCGMEAGVTWMVITADVVAPPAP